MMDLLVSSPTSLVIVSAILGLLVGSFLNVVIYRLPVMMENQWKLDTGQETADTIARFNLITPASTCPHCQHKIQPWENIPLLSYLFLRGRCVSCKAPISPQYPLVELFTALLSALVAWQLGFGWLLLAALVFTWTLVALTMIDYNTQLLPDTLTLPLLWLGLLINSGSGFTDLNSAVWGAAAGYLSLWLVYQLFKLATGKEGMGYGDFKLLAAIGAWCGWQVLPVTIILSSVIGAITGIIMILFKRHQQGTPIPFGPFLAGAGWISLFWGKDLMEGYLRFAGTG
jgi:leader peptidase (prepilin peptidase)/N-methyltransferase